MGNSADMRDESPVDTMKNIQIIPLADGPITVAFKKDGPYCLATALEFDIVGTGKTRTEALNQLQELVSVYLFEVLTTTGKRSLYNPSEQIEWEAEDKARYTVQMIVRVTRHSGPTPSRPTLSQARPFRKNIEQFNLTPACYV